MEDEKANERYSRHYLLKGFGKAAQHKLTAASVLVIGAGGLGCPALQYLAAAGIGAIGIADHDTVSLSNLHRQILYTVSDIGRRKATVASERLSMLNPDVSINAHIVKVSKSNIFAMLQGYDIVVDGTDNFAARYLINDACAIMCKPLVFGAVYQYEGQVAIFNVPDESGLSANYRHLFPKAPDQHEVPDCSVAGVLGVLPGIIGTMQATEVIKLITGIGEPLSNSMFTYNALSNQLYTVEIPRRNLPSGAMPLTSSELAAFDYNDIACQDGNGFKMIDGMTFQAMLADPQIAVIDVRHPDELPNAGFGHLNISLDKIAAGHLETDQQEIIVFCQSGKRSQQAAEILALKYGNTKTIYSLQGGILSLPQNLLIYE